MEVERPPGTDSSRRQHRRRETDRDLETDMLSTDLPSSERPRQAVDTCLPPHIAALTEGVTHQPRGQPAAGASTMCEYAEMGEKDVENLEHYEGR